MLQEIRELGNRTYESPEAMRTIIDQIDKMTLAEDLADQGANFAEARDYATRQLVDRIQVVQKGIDEQKKAEAAEAKRLEALKPELEKVAHYGEAIIEAVAKLSGRWTNEAITDPALVDACRRADEGITQIARELQRIGE